ncbi:MAG: TetR/AcrR family transcriptional regulator [Candidatus Sericytochromatia bacterium]
MSESTLPTDSPLSDDELDALEQALHDALEQDTPVSELLPPVQAYQATRRQRQRLRPTVARKAQNTYHHGNLRQSLIGIAMEHAAATGVHGLSLRQIAKQAGVSAPALYRHFADKDALLAAVAEQGLEELKSWLEEAVAPGIPPQQGLLRLARSYTDFMHAYPLYRQLLLGAEVFQRERFPALMPIYQDTLAPLVRLLLEGRQTGVFHTQLAPEDQALLVWTALGGLALLLEQGMVDAGREAVLAGWLAVLQQGLQAG